MAGPYSYWGQHVDTRVPPNPEMVAKAVMPDYGLGNHVAPLGFTFYQGSLFAEQYRGGAFIGEHGSWNRRPFGGYKVVFVAFADGKPSGLPVDFLTGFVGGDGDALGRPVGVAVDGKGALLVADDVGNTVWRVTPASAQIRARRSRPLKSRPRAVGRRGQTDHHKSIVPGANSSSILTRRSVSPWACT